MHTTPISFPSELIAKVVRCVEDAVGDDIRADIRQHDLQTRNSIPSRIWDLLINWFLMGYSHIGL